ncbi:MAG: 3-hydroxyacyl-ACP dehydratase FabZ family protein [Planctomycetota bacterium]|nr:3-hydroxyacyl-ACP dehydratase FabZ family protein [Planctomycetota bacterium]
MPTESLIDFDALALDETVASRDELRELIQQRHEFEMLDGLVHEAPDTPLLVAYKDIRADDWWARGHIPGRPLFPAALMIEAAAQLSSYDYLRHRHSGESIFAGFGGIDRARFRGTVQPGCRLLIACRVKRARSKMFTYTTQGFVERKLVFEAEIMGVVV